jgi:hypothetical protein
MILQQAIFGFFVDPIALITLIEKEVMYPPTCALHLHVLNTTPLCTITAAGTLFARDSIKYLISFFCLVLALQP